MCGYFGGIRMSRSSPARFSALAFHLVRTRDIRPPPRSLPVFPTTGNVSAAGMHHARGETCTHMATGHVRARHAPPSWLLTCASTRTPDAARDRDAGGALAPGTHLDLPVLQVPQASLALRLAMARGAMDAGAVQCAAAQAQQQTEPTGAEAGGQQQPSG